jgi:hypothetical protein
VETYTTWRSTTIGPTATFDITAPLGSDFGWSVDVSSRSRTGQTALYEAVTPQPLTREINIRPGTAAAGTNMDDWRAAAVAFFSPFLGPATLAANFGGDTRTTLAVVSQIQQHPQVAMRSDKQGILQAKLTRYSPYWRSASQSTTSLTVTNDGNAPANPKITIKPSSGTVTRRRVTFTENTGRGVVNHLLQLAVTTDASATAGSNYYVFDNGNPTLFQIITPGGSSKLYIRKSLRPSSTTEYVDVVMGSAVANTVSANQLPPWGYKFDDAAFSNTVWVYRSTAGTINSLYAPAVWELSRAPQIPGVWFATRFGTPTASDAWNEGATSVQFIGAAAMQLNTQVEMGTTGAINGFTLSSLVGWSDLNVKYRLPEANEWLTGDATVSGGSTLSDIEVDGGVDAILRSQLSGDTWQEQASSAPISVTLDSAKVPGVSVGSSVTMARINGRLRNTTTGDYVDVFDMYIDADASGGLVIDTLAGGVEKNRVYPSLSTSPMYSGSGGQGYAFSNPAGLPLVPGANVLVWNAVGTNTGSGDGAPTITTAFSDTWI